MALNVSSLALNGTNRYAKLSTNASLKAMENFSWMAWIKVGPLSTNLVQRAYVERQGTGSGIRFACTPVRGRLRFEFSATDGRTDTNYDYKYTWDDRWHHVAFVARISGTNPSYSMYIDGVEIASGTLIKNSGVNAVSNTAPLGSIYVGNHSLATSESFPADRYWDGGIDEILIYNAAKNASDILAYAASDDTADMTDTEMFSYWRFDENTGSSTVDSDNTGWTGTLFQSGVASSALWQIDRPFLGNGTVDSTAPAIPTLPATPTTSITSDGFTATWNATTDNVFVQYYELHVSTLSNFSSYTSYDMGKLLTKVIKGLPPATNHYWRVRALDAELNASGYTATQSLTTSTTGDVTPPVPPTALNATSISHSSFTVNYTASASTDETGYKIDVALDSSFTNYLTGFRNKDIGNILTTVVTGTSPLKTYYVRVRAYDAAANESAASTTLVVQTPTQPDVMPPSTVELAAPSSLTSRAFTANWEEGFDNVGIVSYEIDVSEQSDFSTYVTNAFGTWQAKNVGNVTAYRVEDLAPERVYYYRVRAYDAAGNISGSQIEGMTAQTTASTIEDGGFITLLLEPQGDSWTDSAATAVNHGTETSLIVLGNGAANTRNAFLQFDLTTVIGVIQNAVLNLYVTEASAANVAVAVDNVTFNETTLTWANQPTVAGSTLNMVPSATGQWVSVDISSLILDGATTYTVKLSTISIDGATFDSKEGTNRPYLEVEYDPSTATNIVSMDVTDASGVLTNYITNPSGEDSSTTKWFAAGTGVVITNVSDNSMHGSRALNATCDGTVAAQGFTYAPSEIVAVNGETWTASVSVKSVSGATDLNLFLRVYNTDGSVVVRDYLVPITISGVERRFSVTRTLSDAAAGKVTVMVRTATASAATFRIDKVFLEKISHDPAYFDGDTSGAAWTGTVKASTSTFALAKPSGVSTYIGDADGDNSVVPAIKPSTDVDWISLPAMTTDVVHNRSTKTVTSPLGPSYGRYNEIPNPSFEVDIADWFVNMSATIARDTDFFDYEEGGVASAKVTPTASVGSGIYTQMIKTAQNDTVTVRARIRAPIGSTPEIWIWVYSAANANLGMQPASGTLLTTRRVIGDDTWQTAWFTTTISQATANHLRVGIGWGAGSIAPFYADHVQIQRSSSLSPYLDGTILGGVWEGNAHRSTTGLVILPETSYDFMHTYTDPDGLINNVGQLSASTVDTHTTAKTPDNVTTLGAMTLTPTTDTMTVSTVYTGDDNLNMTARIEYRRTDLTNWADIPPIINRTDKTISGTIANLSHGTSYTIRLTATDADGVYGGTSGVITSVGTTLVEQAAVVSSSRIMFGGFVLFDGANQTPNFGVLSHDAFGLPSRRVQVEDLPLVDGAIELMNVWGRREIRMRGFVAGATRAELEDNKNALKKALAPRLQRLVIDTLGTSGRYYNATCASLDITQEGERNNTHLIWDANFVCADPFAYDALIASLPDTTVTNGGSFVVTNNGDLRTDTTLSLYTTHNYPTTLTIANTSTGERITPQVTIVSGDVLTLDSATYSIRKNGIEVNYAGGFIRLNPGGNTISFTISATSGTPSIVARMTWQPKYI